MPPQVFGIVAQPMPRIDIAECDHRRVERFGRADEGDLVAARVEFGHQRLPVFETAAHGNGDMVEIDQARTFAQHVVIVMDRAGP